MLNMMINQDNHSLTTQDLKALVFKVNPTNPNFSVQVIKAKTVK